jgi:ribosomal protein S18 acetylase RimI-like enzyme
MAVTEAPTQDHRDVLQPEPRLRALRPTDRSALARLGTDLFRPFGDYSSALPDWLRRPGVWGRVLDDGRGRPAGLALVTITRSRNRQHHGYVLAIGVAEGLQRGGWGRLLLDEGLAELRKRKKRFDLETVRLTVAPDNEAAMRLFESAGFRSMPHEIEHYEDGQRAIRLSRPLD